MIVKIGINGFGRIGRVLFRVLNQIEDVEVVAINDPMNLEMLRYLLKYDTIHGNFNGTIEINNNKLVVNGREITVTSFTDPAKIPWKSLGVSIVVDSSGKFADRASLEKHFTGGAEKVILACPPNGELDKTIVLGINDSRLTSQDRIISNASCTANCLAPVLKTIDMNFGLASAFMNTVHPFTNNQSFIDAPHGDDYRRSRAATHNIIPTDSTAIKALHLVLPEMKGKIDGLATRVPVADGSLIEININLQKSTTTTEVNRTFKAVSQAQFLNILSYTEDPIVSSDIIGNPHSAIFDSRATKMIGDKFLQIIVWYDNEFGYSSRLADLIKKVASL